MAAGRRADVDRVNWPLDAEGSANPAAVACRSAVTAGTR
jgi:hypothetical protein